MKVPFEKNSQHQWVKMPFMAATVMRMRKLKETSSSALLKDSRLAMIFASSPVDRAAFFVPLLQLKVFIVFPVKLIILLFQRCVKYFEVEVKSGPGDSIYKCIIEVE